jgi:hypothetical protein
MNLHKVESVLIRVFSGFFRLFAVDARSLALLRIALALTTLYDLNDRWGDIHNHYTDAGVLPRSFTLQSFTNHYWITVHMISGADFAIQCLFLVQAFFSCCMLIGYRTRLFTFLNWLMVCSLQNRNYIVCHSGDTVQRVILFWSIFLPLGRCFSVDAALSSNKPGKNTSKGAKGSNYYEVVNVASACLTLQIIGMYWFAHQHKTGAEWRETRIATWMALQLDYFRTPFGDILVLFPGLTKILTALVLTWQKYGCILYFFPVYNKYFKTFFCGLLHWDAYWVWDGSGS